MEFSADLSPRQLSALSRGRKVRIAHAAMGRGAGFVVHPDNHKKLMRAFEKQKGADIQLSQDEVEANGGKIGHSSVNRNKKAGKWLGTLGGIAKSVGKFVKPAAVPIREALVNRAVGQIDPTTAAQNSLEDAATTLSPFFNKTPKRIAGPPAANPMIDYRQYNAENGTNFGYQTQAGVAQAYANAYQPYSMSTIAPQTSAYNIDSYEPVYAYGGLSSFERYGQGISGGKLASVGAKGQPVWGNLQARASQADMIGFKQHISPIYKLKGAGLYL